MAHNGDGGRRQASTRPSPPTASDRGSDTADRIFVVLTKHLSPPSARAAIIRAEHSRSSRGHALRPADVAAFFAEVEKSASAFLDRKSQSLLHGELQFELGRLVADLGSHEDSSPGSVPSIDVRNEWDLSVVRAHAREAVTKLGGKSWDVVKGMTLVSELARNVVLYTKGGRVDFVASTNPRGLTVRVVDQGPGIANLEQVLSGKYRSKTGLGKGLLGAKQLCHRFDIESDATGTRIEAEMRF